MSKQLLKEMRPFKEGPMGNTIQIPYHFYLGSRIFRIKCHQCYTRPGLFHWSSAREQSSFPSIFSACASESPTSSQPLPGGCAMIWPTRSTSSKTLLGHDVWGSKFPASCCQLESRVTCGRQCETPEPQDLSRSQRSGKYFVELHFGFDTEYSPGLLTGLPVY